MAAGKLQEILPQRPITFKGQNIANLSVLGVSLLIAAYLTFHPEASWLFPLIIVIPLDLRRADDRAHRRRGYADGDLSAEFLRGSLGGGDGICARQQAADRRRVLDGASGFILSVNMSKAMNRSFTNVLFGAFGQEQAAAAGGADVKPVKSATAGRSRCDSFGGEQGDHRARLWNGRGAGPAQGAGAL